MLSLPHENREIPVSLYEPLGLKDLPFPPEPVADPRSDDPRKNGIIYAESPVQDAIQKFERLLIRPNDFPNRVKLASLWSKGDAQSGRGMGKTALLRFFQRKINSDWGATVFSGQFSAVVTYVSFQDQVHRRYMEQLAWSALVDVCNNDVLDASRAALRRNALSPQQVDAVINAEGDVNYDHLLNDTILKDNQISPADLDSTIEERLVQEGIDSSSARALSRGDFENHLRSFRKDRNLVPYYVPYNTKGLDYSRSLFFNTIVNYLRAAGFAGGYLFVDDIENLVDQMTRRDRLEFAKEFGLCTVRPGYANTAHSFFSCVLTTHQSSALALSQAWAEAGLSGMVRLGPDAPTSVELPLPTQNEAREIIIAHLDHFRINRDELGTIKPFTEESLDAHVSNSQHPRALLSSAARVVLRATAKEITLIDVETVKEAMDSTSPPATDFTEGLDEAM